MPPAARAIIANQAVKPPALRLASRSACWGRRLWPLRPSNWVKGVPMYQLQPGIHLGRFPIEPDQPLDGRSILWRGVASLSASAAWLSTQPM
jgi:hypothetical protein